MADSLYYYLTLSLLFLFIKNKGRFCTQQGTGRTDEDILHMVSVRLKIYECYTLTFQGGSIMINNIPYFNATSTSGTGQLYQL